MSAKKLPPIEDIPQYRPGVGRYCSYCAMKYLTEGERPDSGFSLRKRPGSRGFNLENRITSLQQNISFLQRQHRDTLSRLHVEIDRLKRDNRDLQYRMVTSGGRKKRVGISKMCQTCEGEDCDSPLEHEQHLEAQRAKYLQATATCKFDPFLDAKGRLITSLQPLRLQPNPCYPPRPPTTQDVEIIVNQLYNANCLQFQEITRVKALLKEIVASKRITAENLALTETYLKEETHNHVEETRNPKIFMQLLPDKKSVKPNEPVILPVLKHRFISTAVERQKKTRALQKERLSKLLK